MLQVALRAIKASSYAAGCTESHQTLLMLQVALKAITALELQLGTVNRNADCAASQAVRERKLLQHQIIASSLLGRHQVGELFELQSLLVPVACHFCARAPFSLQTTDRHTHTHTHTCAAGSAPRSGFANFAGVPGCCAAANPQGRSISSPTCFEAFPAS